MEEKLVGELCDKFPSHASFVHFIASAAGDADVAGYVATVLPLIYTALIFTVTLRLHAAITRGDVCSRTRMHASCWLP